ncbi:hypothetical protein ACN47E_001046 [Coniothyrium glycines]
MDQTRILVTGGCGFLGTSIVSRLLETNSYAITAIDINPPPPGTTTFASSVRYMRANVLDVDALQKVFNQTRPAIVVHTVGVYPLGAKRYSMDGREAVFRVNVEGTRNVLRASRECGAKGLVYTSSVTVLFDELDQDFRNVDERWTTGRATTSYGLSKTMAEDLVLAANTHDFVTCTLRSAPIFGPDDPGCIPIIHSCIAAYQTPFILGSGTNLQDFVFVDNIADAHVLAVGNLLTSRSVAGEAIFITNGEPITARDFCLATWKEFGHVPRFQVRVPQRLAWWVGLGAEWVTWLTGIEGALSRGIVNDGCRERYVNLAKARELLEYKPRVNLLDGLRISCQHFQKRIDDRAKR